MDPVTATAPWWAPAAAAAGGALLQGIASSAFNAFQADKNRDFQERMSGSAHQREVEDLKRAGLNPILSARLGGSSSPPGATAQASVPEGAVTSALQATLLRGNVALQQAQIADINSAARLKDAQASDVNATQAQRIGLMIAQAYQALQSGNLTAEQRSKVIDEIRLLQSQKALADQQTAHSAATLHREYVKSKPYEYAGKAIDWAERNVPKIQGPIKKGYDYIKKDPLKQWLKDKLRR